MSEESVARVGLILLARNRRTFQNQDIKIPYIKYRYMISSSHSKFSFIVILFKYSKKEVPSFIEIKVIF
jgi:hypothetical protein